MPFYNEEKIDAKFGAEISKSNEFGCYLLTDSKNRSLNNVFSVCLCPKISPTINTLIKSSSIPPAVATIQSTILCCARNRITSRTPHEAIFEVYPKKILQFESAPEFFSFANL